MQHRGQPSLLQGNAALHGEAGAGGEFLGFVVAQQGFDCAFALGVSGQVEFRAAAPPSTPETPNPPRTYEPDILQVVGLACDFFGRPSELLNRRNSYRTPAASGVNTPRNNAIG